MPVPNLDPKQQAMLDSLSPAAKAAIEKLLATGDRKTIAMSGAGMALMSAAHAARGGQITDSQFYDIVSCTLQFIWCESSNDLCSMLLSEEEKDIQGCAAMSMLLGGEAAQKAGRRLQLLMEMCQPAAPASVSAKQGEG